MENDSGTPPLRLEWIAAGTLDDNPHNWRRHPPGQLAGLREALDDPGIGWAGALLYNERTGRLIDGHARKKLSSPDDVVPVLIGSWSEDAEKKILATLDPLCALARADDAALQALLTDVDFETETLKKLAAGLPVSGSAKLRAVNTDRPCAMAWVLIGIPLARYHEVAATIEELSEQPDVFCEAVASDKTLPTGK